ncbi:MAG: alpha/beta fold hydrolase [Elusimicrobia bacterium]|nr:alpha/beta fold hydrolase [Elusimicrobiota bacterium]MBD3412005.1 alpha/beta fold hydrolase [Elusimicrobiota bacterium]
MLAMKNRLFPLVCIVIIGTCTQLFSQDKVLAPSKDVSIKLKSGIIIKGTFWEPKDPSKHTLVLLHGLGSNRGEWKDFAERVNRLGFGVFTYDSRGHGESTLDDDGNKIDYTTFPKWGKKTPWNLMVDDLDEILVYLENLEGCDKNKFILGGASLGANVALTCASRKKNIAGLILLSPGLDYAGVTTEYPMRFCKVKPIFIAAAQGDVYAYTSSQKLVSFKPNKKHITEAYLPTNEHGVTMFRSGLDADLFDWLTQKIK